MSCQELLALVFGRFQSLRLCACCAPKMAVPAPESIYDPEVVADARQFLSRSPDLVVVVRRLSTTKELRRQFQEADQDGSGEIDATEVWASDGKWLNWILRETGFLARTHECFFNIFACLALGRPVQYLRGVVKKGHQ